MFLKEAKIYRAYFVDEVRRTKEIYWNSATERDGLTKK